MGRCFCVFCHAVSFSRSVFVVLPGTARYCCFSSMSRALHCIAGRLLGHVWHKCLLHMHGYTCKYSFLIPPNIFPITNQHCWCFGLLPTTHHHHHHQAKVHSCCNCGWTTQVHLHAIEYCHIIYNIDGSVRRVCVQHQDYPSSCIRPGLAWPGVGW